MRERILYVDIAKFVGITLMVIGHSGLTGYLENWIYAFHMPFFFLISGMFMKDVPSLHIRMCLRRMSSNY